MKQSQVIHELTLNGLRSLLAWVRFLTGLLAGSLTALAAFAQHTSMHPLAFKISIFMIFVAICVGSYCISFEANASQRAARRLWEGLDKHPHEDGWEIASIIDLTTSEARIVRLFYLGFVLSLASMAIGAFVPQPAPPVITKEAEQAVAPNSLPAAK